MQSASSRIWTRNAVSISYDDNHYTRWYPRGFDGWNKEEKVEEDVFWLILLEVRIWADIIGGTLFDPQKVPDGIKMTADAYILLVKK